MFVYSLVPVVASVAASTLASSQREGEQTRLECQSKARPRPLAVLCLSCWCLATFDPDAGGSSRAINPLRLSELVPSCLVMHADAAANTQRRGALATTSEGRFLKIKDAAEFSK